MKLVSIVFDKAASEYKLYYKDEEKCLTCTPQTIGAG